MNFKDVPKRVVEVATSFADTTRASVSAECRKRVTSPPAGRNEVIRKNVMQAP